MKKATKVTIIFVIVMTIISVKAFYDYQKEMSLWKEQEKKVLADKQNEEKRKSELDNTKDIYSSPSAVMEIAREVLGLVKPGEKFYRNYNNQ